VVPTGPGWLAISSLVVRPGPLWTALVTGRIWCRPGTGLVGDLVNGSAQMAMAAFSVTRARSRVIDFTAPYFYAGFSIVVAEEKRRPPIYAFMEPFDGWVWISIVVSLYRSTRLSRRLGLSFSTRGPTS